MQIKTPRWWYEKWNDKEQTKAFTVETETTDIVATEMQSAMEKMKRFWHEDVTLKNIAKSIGGVLVSFTLFVICGALMNGSMHAIALQPHVPHLQRLALPAMFILSSLIQFKWLCFDYLFYLTNEQVSGLVSYINPVREWQANCVKILFKSWRFLWIALAAYIAQWCEVAMSFHPDYITSIFRNETVLRAMIHTHQRIFLRCYFEDYWILFCIISLVLCMFGEGNGRKEPKGRKPAEWRLWVRRVYGTDLIDRCFHMLHFWFLIYMVSLFPVIAGLVTDDYVKSFSFFEYLSQVTIPAYAFFLGLRVVTEVTIYHAERFRMWYDNRDKYKEMNCADVKTVAITIDAPFTPALFQST